MIPTTILQFIGITAFLVSLSACSGGGGEGDDPLAPQQASEDPTAPPAEPPAEPPTVPPVEPPTNPPATPPTRPPTPPPAAPLPVGLWSGNTQREPRTVTGAVLQDGRSWFMYSSHGTPDIGAHVALGTMQMVDGTNWKMDNGFYANTIDEEKGDFSPTGTWLAGQRLTSNYRITYDYRPEDPAWETNSMDLVYNIRSGDAFAMQKAAGRYVGIIRAMDEFEFILAADGTMTGRAATGCNFNGQATPNGPVAEVVITFDTIPCWNGGATLRGILIADTQAGKIYTASVSQDRNQQFVFFGQR